MVLTDLASDPLTKETTHTIDEYKVAQDMFVSDTCLVGF